MKRTTGYHRNDPPQESVQEMLPGAWLPHACSSWQRSCKKPKPHEMGNNLMGSLPGTATPADSAELIAEGNAASHPTSLLLLHTDRPPCSSGRRSHRSLLFLWALLSLRSQGTCVVRIISSSPTALFKIPPLGIQQVSYNPSGNSFSLRITALATRQGRTHNCPRKALSEAIV